MTLIIGDVHGDKYPKHENLSKYAQLTQENEHTIQLGDVGFLTEYQIIETLIPNGQKHKIVLGNHDYRKENSTLNNPRLIEKFGYYGIGDHDFFCIAGAESVDRNNRFSGIDWFKDEELSILEGTRCIEEYSFIKPDFVLSHDCPNFIAKRVMNFHNLCSSRTRSLLECLWIEHTPKVWIFGHHHRSFNEIIDGCNFICLSELETLEFNF